MSDPAASERPDAVAAQEAGAQNLPAPGETPDEVVDVRRGMFGARGSGDTSGYGGLVRTVAMPGATPAPWGGWFDEAVDSLRATLRDAGTDDTAAIEKIVVDRGELCLHVAAAHLPAVAQRLRDEPDLRFEMCMGVSGVHFPNDVGRELHAVYPLLSITHNRRLRLEVSVPESDPRIPSLVKTYPANDWHEREVWDFFGVLFEGHPSLTRIQMPDDWPGHPQRKDYPLGGIPVEYKGAQVPPPDTRRSYT